MEMGDKIMKKTIEYLYLGENGTILTPVKLEVIYSVKKYNLVAEDGKYLTKDGENLFTQVHIPISEIDEWYEV